MTSGTPRERLEQLTSDFLSSLFAAHPTMAASLGLHEYDGRVQDFGESAEEGRIAALAGFASRAAGVPADALGNEERHDLALLRLSTDEELFELTSLREVERNPLAFSGVLDVSGYIKRNYAPLVQRVRSLTEHLRQYPIVVATACERLRSPVPLPFLDTAREVYEGTIQFHEHDLPAAVRAVGPGSVWEAFDHANVAAVAALREFLRYLDDNLRPRAGSEFAIGEDRFATMLRLGEMVDLSTERLLEIGRDDMATNAARLREIAAEVDPGVSVSDVIRRQSADHPSSTQLIPAAARVLEELRAFVETRGLVSIPSDVRCVVEETPPFARWAFAMMDTAGPFETSTESFYYVTPPEPGWTAEQTDSWLSKFDYATLRDVGIHEVYPGHYVHFLHMKQVSSALRKVIASYSFVEGWAHYCEEMMLAEGYGAGDRRLRIAQLSEALLRDVRFIVSIQMHTRGMTVQDATRMFIDEAHMEALPAEKEAIRGTFDPGYLNYTLGKLMIRKLRDDVRAQRGAAFTLRAFHDDVLALGAPPVPLARRRLIGQSEEYL
jgi:uncharacterized protein (DUF885 family)